MAEPHLREAETEIWGGLALFLLLVAAPAVR